MNLEETQIQADQVPHDAEFSFFDVATLVLRQRRLIVISTLASVLFALMVALGTEREYTASASFIPHGSDQGGFSGVASLAQQFGFSLPQSLGGSERTPEFYRDLLGSRVILDEVAKEGVAIVTTSGVTAVDLAEHFEIEAETSEERNALIRRYLAQNIISVSIGRDTGVVTLSITTDDPGLSAAIGRRLLDLMSDFDSDTRQSQAKAERDFAEGRLGELEMELAFAEDSLKAFLVENRQFSNSPQLVFEEDRLQRQVTMRQELVSAIAQAYEQARIEEVRNLPVITVIDHPEPPALANARGRLTMLVLGLIVGLMVGLVLAFSREFSERAKSKEGSSYLGFQELISKARKDPLGLR